MAQVDTAIAVVVDAILDIGRRQELRLPDLAGISADQVAQRQVAALHDLNAAINSPWNNSVRRQSQASVASVRTTGSLPMSPLPLSVSSVQIAMMSAPARRTAARCATGAGRALHQRLGALDARRDDAGRGIFLEALGVEHAALAAVEGEHILVDRDAGEGLVDNRAMDAGACASRDIAAMKALKSPPHLAASAGAAKTSKTESAASGRNIMGVLIVPRAGLWHGGGNQG